MRRFQRQTGGTFFKKSEWFRLISMLFMLIILYMMIQRARDESVWRWLVNDSGAPETDQAAAVPEEMVEAGKAVFDGPTDLDVDEREAAEELFSVLSDQTPLSVEEMPAYLRMVRWSRAQSLDELRKRARRDVTLSHFIEEPDKLRGEVVRLRLHLRRSLSWEFGPEENAGGAKTAYEAWGWSDESPNFYCIVFTQLPRGMPIGPNEMDEVTFYGYFLKLLSYRDQQDKLRMAPLLIGRVARHAAPPAAPSEGPWALIVTVAGGLIILMWAVRWTRGYAFPRYNEERMDKNAGRAALSKWLQRTSRPERDEWEAGEVSEDGEEQEDSGEEEEVVRRKRPLSRTLPRPTSPGGRGDGETGD